MDYLDHIKNKEAFKETIKAALDKAAFTRLDDMKKNIANEFLQGGENK